MYGFWLLSAWILIGVCFASGVVLLAIAVSKSMEYALPRLAAGWIMVLSAALVLLVCRFATWAL